MSKPELIKQLLQHQKDDPKEIELIYRLQKEEERKEFWNEIRSWIGVVISFIALLISTLVALNN